MALTKIERPMGRDGFMRLTNKYDADMKRVSMGYAQGGDLPTLGYWNDFIYDGEKVAARHYGLGGGGDWWYLYHNEGPSIYAPLVGHSYATVGWASRWHLFDALGSTVGMTDTGGGLIGSLLYEAFGQVLGSGGTGGGDPYAYVGACGYYQDEFGLHLLRHRWYDRGTGRFASRSQAMRQGTGAYRYVRGNPTTRISTHGERRDPCADVKDIIDTLADQVQKESGGSAFPPSCQALNDQLYRYLNCKYGFTSGPAGPYTPWPPRPSARDSFWGLSAYRTWFNSCHRPPPCNCPSVADTPSASDSSQDDSTSHTRTGGTGGPPITYDELDQPKGFDTGAWNDSSEIIGSNAYDEWAAQQYSVDPASWAAACDYYRQSVEQGQ